MRNKVLFKFLIVLFILSLNVCLVYNCVYATENNNFDLSKFDSEDNTSANSILTPTQNILQTVLTVMRTVCLGIAFVMIIVLAMKYMIASPGERADIKKSSVQYVIGAVIMFGAAGILKLIVTFVNGAFN